MVDNIKKLKIAIIGSGVSGLVASMILSRKHNVTIFEKNNKMGGHVHTHKLKSSEKIFNVDSGFIVYNERTYPNFIKLLNQLDVETIDTSMGFSYKDQNDFEYSGNSLSTLFSKKSNMLNINFYFFIYNILRFNRISSIDISNIDSTITLDEYLQSKKLSDDVIHKYIIPMGAAIWSTNPSTMKSMPAKFFIRFFMNHGLLDIKNRPQWKVIKNGSSEYVKKIYKSLKQNNAKIKLDFNIKKVFRTEDKIKIKDDNNVHTFDKVVLACHSNQALKMIQNPTNDEKNILSSINYQENRATIHTDTSVLPNRKKAWSSWNYLSTNETENVVLTYNMNILQNLKSDKVFCVTINDPGLIDKKKIIKEIKYEHPLFTPSCLKSQSKKDLINGKNNTYFAGAYWGYGFHEDGVNSALDVCKYFDMDL